MVRGKLECVVILCSCWIYLVSSQQTQPSPKDPVDFTVLDDSTINQAQKSGDGLPLDVNVNFDVLGKHVSLKLKRNPKVTSAKDIYVIRKSQSGIPVLVPQTLQENEVFGEFQDIINGAIFTLSCPKQNANSTDCNPTMEGTFRSGQEKYLLSPMEENAMGRVKRSVNKLWARAKKLVTNAKSFSKVYGIYKTEQTPGTPTDFKDATALVRGRVNAAFGQETKTVRENVLPGGRMYNLEILAVIDYSLYERFYKASNEGTEEAKDNDAKYKLKKYFSHVFNGVDMLYQSIDDPDFSMSVGVSGFIIADSPDVSSWTTPHIDRNIAGRHDLLVSVPLDELLRWSFSARNIPENDHIMLMTDYDLYSFDDGVVDKRTAGYARVGSVCSLDSVSVIEDHGGFQSINAAAHELGHGLGSRHDGRMNRCDPNEQFIMTAHGGFETENTKTNPWTFSTCSVAYFKEFISGLPPRHCLTDPIDIFDREQYEQFVSTYPGQDYTPNEQCQDILGLDSYYGWGTELGKFSTICTEMSCKVPGAGRSYRVYKAATGTSCGDKRWCVKGTCVFDEKAPSRNPSCVFGDTQRRFGSLKLSCRQYMLDNPMRCYDSFYKSRCCDTCDKLNTGVKDCEYGDKFLNCQRRGCFDPSYAKDCCSTCGLAPHPVIRTTPVTRPTTTTTTTQRPTTRRPVTVRQTTTTRRPTTVRRTTTRRPTTVKRTTTRQPPFVWRTTRRWTFIPSMITTTRRPVLTRRTTTRSPPRRTTTTERPRPTTTKTSTKPSGNSGMCLRMNERFLLVFKCSSLTSLFGPDACDNSLVARYCCERCPEKGTEACEDTPTCQVRYARQCYIQSNRDKCCRTCRRFETGQSGCEYGDKIRSCERYVGQMGLSAVCSKYKSYCCGVCSSLAATNDVSKVVSLPKPSDFPDDAGVVKIGHTNPTEKTLAPTAGAPTLQDNNVDSMRSRGKPGKSGKKENKSKDKQNKQKKGRRNKNNSNIRPMILIPSVTIPRPDISANPNSSSRVWHRIVFRPSRGRRFNGRSNRRINFVVGG